MPRGRGDGDQKKRLVTWIVVLVVICGCVYLYSRNSGTSALEYGSKSLRKIGSSYLGVEGDGDEASNKSSEELYVDVMLKSILVCDDRHSKLILFLDRNVIYQTRLKLDLSLMERYDRHCPVLERRFNCLIPPPLGQLWVINSGQAQKKIATATYQNTLSSHGLAVNVLHFSPSR